jgi:hypothetical protein
MTPDKVFIASLCFFLASVLIIFLIVISSWQ